MRRPYYNTNGFPVIQVDNRDPRVSFQNHLKRGSSGGVDLVAAYGTRLRPPSRVLVVNRPWDGTGGNTVRMFELDENDKVTGPYDEYLHLSKFLWKSGTIANPTDFIGESGASGNGKFWMYAPHLHWHRYVNGRRVNPWDYFTFPNAKPASPVSSSPEGSLSVSDVNTIMGFLKNTLKPDHDNIGRRLNEIAALVNEEGRSARVYFNKASGIFAIGDLNYWNALGEDIYKDTIPATWEARRQFGEATVGHYRRYGLAQDFTFELTSEEWDFARMLCLNTGVTSESKQLNALSSVTIASAVKEALAGLSIEAKVNADELAGAVGDVLAKRLTD